MSEFEVARKVIANVHFCEAYLLAVIHNLKMMIHYSQITLRDLEKLNNFVSQESKRLKLESSQANAVAAKKGFLGRIFGGDSTLKGGEIENGESDTVNEVLEGGKIQEIEEFKEKLKKKSQDFETVDLLIETSSLISMALGFITSNEETALVEANDALLCVQSSLVIGVPLETKITEMQFVSNNVNELKNHAVAIQTFNATISRLSSILHKLFAVVKNLVEDVKDTTELVDQVRKIVSQRSAEKDNVGILKWFTTQTSEAKSDVILSSIESVFSSMDFVIFFCKNASINLETLEKKVDINMISFSAVPQIHSQNKMFGLGQAITNQVPAQVTASAPLPIKTRA
jgi:hypothetical protein